ncbi:MAG: hypothetical protein SF339_25195 [Blastocatellia bacterium]|nr:hypothetical protein [Blastocatellia bacterium]
MTTFRIYLVIVIICLGAYTMVVGVQHGWNLLPIFLGDIGAMTWPGQFNFDFMTFLMLSALWVSWRHQFSAGGLALGIVAFFGGMMFLAPYLLYASSQASGDMKVVFLGKARAGLRA